MVRLVERVKELQQRPLLASALTVHRRVGEVNGGMLAAGVTLTLFLTIFPVLLVSIALLGFASAGNADLGRDLVEDLGLTGDAADFVTDSLTSAEGSRTAASLVGFLGLVWTSLGLAGAIEQVCDRTWQLPTRGLTGKLYALGWLLASVVLLGGSIALTGLLTVLPGWLWPVQLLAGIALSVGFFLFTFRVLTSKSLPWRVHLPGAVLGGVGVQVLTAVATLLLAGRVAHSSALYGSMGVVFALLAWLLLFGRLLVYSVALNVVRYEAAHGTVRVEVEVPRFDGEVPLSADRSAVVQERTDVS